MTSSILLAAVLSLLPAATRPTEGPPQEPEWVRLQSFTLDVLEAVQEADEKDGLPFSGTGKLAATGLALVAIAWHESRFDARVVDCRRRGPSGDATAFQLLGPFARGPYTLKQLCASNKLAAERAIAVLRAAQRQCSRAAPLAMFQGYASGRCGRPAPVRILRRGELVTIDPDAGATRCRTWEKLARASGLVASCSGATRVSLVEGRTVAQPAQRATAAEHHHRAQ